MSHKIEKFKNKESTCKNVYSIFTIGLGVEEEEFNTYQ